MSNFIDISKKITNELPTVKITEDIIVTVNNRKNNILCIQAMVEESTKKGGNEIKLMNKTLEMLVGKKSADEIEALDLPLPEYKEVYAGIMGAATGTTAEEEADRFQK